MCEIDKKRDIEPILIKVKAPERKPGSVLRRTNFRYLNGRGTFYKFDKDHFPDNILNAKYEELVSVVLYNLHTDQLDKVVFELDGYSRVGKKYIWIRGFIADIEDCFEIKIEYFLDNPLESRILVYASARPDYSVFKRL